MSVIPYRRYHGLLYKIQPSTSLFLPSNSVLSIPHNTQLPLPYVPVLVKDAFLNPHDESPHSACWLRRGRLEI